MGVSRPHDAASDEINPSLTLRVSFGFATLLAWSTRAKRENRNIKNHAREHRGHSKSGKPRVEQEAH